MQAITAIPDEWWRRATGSGGSEGLCLLIRPDDDIIRFLIADGLFEGNWRIVKVLKNGK